MKWYDAHKMWPQLNSGELIIEGYTFVSIKPEFTPPGHIDTALLSIRYYCLIDGLESYDEDNGEFVIPGAIFYEIDEYCCSNDLYDDECKKHFRKIGLFAHNIFDFILETRESMQAHHSGVKKWIMLREIN